MEVLNFVKFQLCCNVISFFWWVLHNGSFPRTSPFGPYGGLLRSYLYPETVEETPQRLEQLGAGTGAADVEYEQFLKAKEASFGG